MKKSKSFNKYIIKAFLHPFFILILLAIFNTNIYAQAISPTEQVRNLIKDYYVDEVPKSLLDRSSIEEMLRELGDPYAQYFTPKEFNNFENAINNKIVGIGVRIAPDPEGVKVEYVFDGSTAKKAGIEEGDIITTSNGQSLSGITIDKVHEYLKGDEGSAVSIQIKRNGHVLDLVLLRKVYEIPTVEGIMIDSNIAYISISTFGENTVSELDKVIREMEKQSPSKYIIDLRENLGGYLDTAIDVAGYFIGNNKAAIFQGMMSVEDKDNFGYYKIVRGTSSVNAEKKNLTIDKPMIFLIDEYSASASELLAGAVQDNKKAIFIGTRSYGKGKVQTMWTLSDGSVLKLTIQRFLTPMGKKIDKVGISPDIEISKDISPLAIAELLMGTPDNTRDRSGFIYLTIGGKGYAMDVSKATKDQYWEAFQYILDKYPLASMKLGTVSGWGSAPIDAANREWKLYYPNHRELSRLDSVPVDKKFTVAFSEDVNLASIDSKSIELIDADTGERVPLSFEKTDLKKVVASPKEELEKGQTYYFVVNQGVKGTRGNGLSEGTLSVVQVAND
jgi:carboxyl-terminal processing protease